MSDLEQEGLISPASGVFRYPDVYRWYDEVAREKNIQNPPALYLLETDYMQSYYVQYSVGTDAVLYSTAFASLPEDQQKFVMGHELTHCQIQRKLPTPEQQKVQERQEMACAISAKILNSVAENIDKEDKRGLLKDAVLAVAYADTFATCTGAAIQQVQASKMEEILADVGGAEASSLEAGRKAVSALADQTYHSKMSGLSGVIDTTLKNWQKPHPPTDERIQNMEQLYALTHSIRNACKALAIDTSHMPENIRETIESARKAMGPLCPSTGAKSREEPSQGKH